MANAKPSIKQQRLDTSDGVDVKYKVDQGNPDEDRSPIRRNAGTKIMKVTCPVCTIRYGYNELDGDPGCLQCEANQTIKKIAADRLEKLEAETIQAEKDALEYAEKEAALKKRMANARAGKVPESKSKSK
jgi:hypothetical protein